MTHNDASATPNTADSVSCPHNRERALRERELLLDVREILLDVRDALLREREILLNLREMLQHLREALLREREILLDVREILQTAQQRLVALNRRPDQRHPHSSDARRRRYRNTRPVATAMRCPHRRR